MKAAIYNGKEDVVITELPTPAAGEHDVVIKNLYSSICGTDVSVYFHGPATGHRVTVGSEFGHETVSRVAQVGAEVTGIRVGDLVYPYPRLAKGDPGRAGTLGGFSEYILVPDAEPGKQVYLLSDKINVREACLVEPFTVGCRAARRSQPQTGESAVVFGAGTIGIAAAIALKFFGVSNVMLCDLSDLRLQKAQALGFETCNTGSEDFAQKAQAYFGQAPSLTGPVADIDIWIDAAGAPSVLECYQSLGKIECRMVVVAVLAGMRPVDILHMTYAQQALIGSGGYNPEDVTDVITIMESGTWDIESIITHEFSLDELAHAIEVAGDTDHALNVIIKMTD